MSSLVRWNPVRDMIEMREAMDRMLNASPFYGRDFRANWSLPIDAYATEDSIIIKADVPGLKPEDIQVTLEGDTLTIRGEYKSEKEDKGQNHLIRERVAGKFERVLTVSTPIDGNKVEATFENGVLTLKMPKTEAVKPRAITVKPTHN